MDVERIQKINAMALELMKQGLAADREDAVVQAERIFKARGATEYSSMRETMSKVEAEAEPKPKDGTPLADSQIKDILEKNTQFIIKKFKEMEERMAALEKEVVTVNNRLLSVRQAPSAAPAGQPQQQQTIQRGPNPIISAANHPRSGSYNEGDVSIEKFFYMGRK